MSDSVRDKPELNGDGAKVYVPYDVRKLSYATTFSNPYKARMIRIIEWSTGKLSLLRLIRRFEAEGVRDGQAFWPQAMRQMGIDVQTPASEIDNIPPSGALIIVANHPHGLIDGMVLAEIIGRVRTDYKILTRSLLTEVDEIRQFMIPVPFSHEENAIERSLEMRRTAMAHLHDGGAIVLFPSGAVASSSSMFGPVLEQEWNPFTAKMILRSKAEVLPIYFPGQNSRVYQVANQISATLRQSLLLHEVVHSLNRAQAPVVGRAIGRDALEKWSDNPRGLVAWLREMTLALRNL